MSNGWLRNAFIEIAPSIVKVKAYQNDSFSIGTGFLVHVDGHIITANHVVEDSTRIEVIPENYRKPILAKKNQRHKQDMALITIDYKGLDANFKAYFAPAKISPRHQHVLAGEEMGIAGYAWGMTSTTDSTLFVFKRTIALNINEPRT